MLAQLSPKAHKAVQASENRRRLRWPALYRTEDKLILCHPDTGGAKHRAKLATYVEENLPAEMTWDDRRCWWWMPLNTENLDKILEAFTLAGEIQLRLSEGVKELLA